MHQQDLYRFLLQNFQTFLQLKVHFPRPSWCSVTLPIWALLKSCHRSVWTKSGSGLMKLIFCVISISFIIHCFIWPPCFILFSESPFCRSFVDNYQEIHKTFQDIGQKCDFPQTFWPKKKKKHLTIPNPSQTFKDCSTPGIKNSKSKTNMCMHACAHMHTHIHTHTSMFDFMGP